VFFWQAILLQLQRDKVYVGVASSYLVSQLL